MFRETTQLARTYERRSAEWEETMTRVCQLEADEFLANNCIDFTTMPHDLFDEYLEKSLEREQPYSSREFRSLQAHHSHRREAFDHNVRSFMHRTIMPWRYFESALGLSKDAPGECRYPVAYASGPDQFITVDKGKAIGHMKHLIDDLERYENYEVALIEDHPSVEDLLYTPWLVKGEVAVLTAIFTKSDDGKHSEFAAEFELSETNLCRRYRQQFLTLWGEVADQDKVKQKENVIGRLMQLLEKAGDKL